MKLNLPETHHVWSFLEKEIYYNYIPGRSSKARAKKIVYEESGIQVASFCSAVYYDMLRGLKRS